ncbi:benzoate carboxyl methyltransferase [Tanacetum coccineum]
MLDFCSSVLPHYPHSLRLVPFPVKMFLHGNASWELAPLLNTPPFLLPLSTGPCLGDSDPSHLILEKTLVRLGLLDMLRERPGLRPLQCSPITFGVLDSECCNTSWIFEFLPEHPSKAASDAGLSEFFTTCSFPLPTVFSTADVGGLGISSAGSLMWPEWDSCRARVRGYRDCGRRLPSANETGILKTLPVLKHSIKAIANDDVVFNQCFKIADLGCSSGRNTLLVASNIIDIVIDACRENKRTPSQIQVCLNDLFGNDFNNLFKMLPDFYEKVKKKGENVGSCFVSAVPGSFYDRLFPDQSLHLVYSSYSVHWLSQVPEGLENNTLNVYMAKTSPPNVIQAYGKQFITDFTEFLQLRSEELVRGGRMVLTLVGRSEVDPTSDDGCGHLELLAQSLHDLVKEGRVQESGIYAFNIPIYYPCEEEVRNVIESQGSFSLDSLNVFEVNWDPNDTDYTNMNDLNEPSRAHGKNAAKVVRAYTEPLLTSHTTRNTAFADIQNVSAKV